MTRGEQIEDTFTYHKPTPVQMESLAALRKAAKEMALCISKLCPESADKSEAIRKLRECVMTANASIVLNIEEVPGCY